MIFHSDDCIYIYEVLFVIIDNYVYTRTAKDGQDMKFCHCS
jgi:hypothetical protein